MTAALLVFWVFADMPGMVGTTKPFAFVSMEECLAAGPTMAAMLPERPTHAGPWSWTCLAIPRPKEDAT